MKHESRLDLDSDPDPGTELTFLIVQKALRDLRLLTFLVMHHLMMVANPSAAPEGNK